MGLNIFDYSNYRDFLRDYYNHSKETNSRFSFRYFGLKAGFSSPNFLQRIIKGDRNLSKDFVPKFSAAMGLNKKEQQYFDALVSFNQAKAPEAKRYYLELLHNLKKKGISSHISDDQYEYVSRWYYPVIREMVTLPDFRDDPKWIRARLGNRLKAKEIEDALCTLLRLGLLKRNDNGRLTQAEAHIRTDGDIKDTGSYSFYQQMLTLAKEALASIGADGREFSGVTMTISKRQFGEIRAKIREFQTHIVQYIADNPDVPESVFQLNLMLFPCTMKANGGSRA